MKAILLSIKPKWVAKILNGQKTIEIRKTMPKCDLPIDVYIYCSQGGMLWKEDNWFACDIKNYKPTYNQSGKVVAKFTIRKVEKIEKRRLFDAPFLSEYYYRGEETQYSFEQKTCLKEKNLCEYLNYKDGYAWYIEDLVIFDEPKELSEFRSHNKYEAFINTQRVYRVYKPLTKAPQNYCFVEVEE